MISIPNVEWKETREQYTARLKACCAKVNRSYNVDGLCRAFPRRIQALIDKTPPPDLYGEKSDQHCPTPWEVVIPPNSSTEAACHCLPRSHAEMIAVKVITLGEDLSHGAFRHECPPVRPSVSGKAP
eukprot:5737303-Karenia_brevis.AAC.1